MNPRAWRITTWWGKLIYVFGAWVLAVRILDWLFGLVGVAGLAASITFLIYDVAVLLIGARIFRGKGEPVATPRPWWQMTARQRLSSNLGSWLAVLTALATIGLVCSFLTHVVGSSLDYVLMLLYFGVPAYLYLNSATRLKPVAKPYQLQETANA